MFHVRKMTEGKMERELTVARQSPACQGPAAN